MVGNVGDDSFGADLLKRLRDEGADTEYVKVVENGKTGVANIIVDEASGENRILVIPNANHTYPETVHPCWSRTPITSHYKVAVFQLEIPIRVVLHNMRLAREGGKHVVFNPAPALPLPQSVYHDVDTLILNETESQIISGQSNSTPLELAEHFLRHGVKEMVIVTLGARGLVYAAATGKAGELKAPRPAKVVDTTGAGDTFVGAYAAQRACHLDDEFDFKSALDFASRAASKSVEKAGAMAAIPYLHELD